MTRRALWLTTLLLATGPASASPALRVVATTADLGALTHAIGGDRIAVATLARPTEDPHFVDPKPSHIVTLNRADVLIEGGANLEIGWLSQLVDAARNPRIQAGAPGRIRGSDGIELRDIPSVADRSQGDIHIAGNPHYLMDPENARIVARHIATTLCGIDADGCASYRRNLERFEHALGERLRDWSARLEPSRGRDIVTFHNTWRYFADRFGLRADLFLEPKPGIPPSPPHLASVIDAMKRDGITIILIEPFQQKKTAEVVARHAGARVVEVCQFAGGFAGTDGDYLALMDENVGRIAEALSASGN